MKRALFIASLVLVAGCAQPRHSRRLVLVAGCAQPRHSRRDEYTKASINFLEAAKGDRAVAVRQFSAPGKAALLTEFLAKHATTIERGASYCSRIVDPNVGSVVLRVECYRAFTDAERAAEEQRVRNTNRGVRQGVRLAVYEFVVTGNRQIAKATPVASLWD